MQNVYDEVTTLDQRCYNELELNEDILMEHAANSIAQLIFSKLSYHSKVLIVCGPGNNGGDGLVLARQISHLYDVSVFLPMGAKSTMAKVQYSRAKKTQVNFTNELHEADAIVDCLFGSGLNKALNEDTIHLINQLNLIQALKIACDIPSGINTNGNIENNCFYADFTVTMGAYKTQLYTDEVKDFVGEISIGNLGLPQDMYESVSNIHLLENTDLQLPHRTSLCSHKGNFGHVNVVLGDKLGAGLLCAQAAFAFGAGLVSVIGHKEIELPYHLMGAHKITSNATAIAIGMGLGNHDDKEIEEILACDIPKVIDADLLCDKKIIKVIEQGNCVLTPHPKEFCGLLKTTDIADIDVKECQSNRFHYIKLFIEKYPQVVLLLKGANTLIGYDKNIYINPFGTSVLSQGGSGDVLTGLIASLLAQGYNCLDATLSSSLAHSFTAKNFDKNSYAMLPEDIIEGIKQL